MTKVAVITGGAGGMGLETARILGSDHTVVISDLNHERLTVACDDLARSGIQATAMVCDVTERTSVDQLLSAARKLGDVAAVVHTAGVSPSMASAEAIMRINGLGTIHVGNASYDIAVDGMALVNVASVAGHGFPGAPLRQFAYTHALRNADIKRLMSVCDMAPRGMRASLAYSVSKNFVIWYSKAVAAKFGEKGARVVSVSPGSFDTPMGKLEADVGAGALAELGALKRFGRSAEIAELLAFCASDKPGYLTGTDIVCDGGATAALSLVEAVKLARASR